MAPVRRRPKPTHCERYSPAVTSGGDNVPSAGRLHTVEDVELMQMAHKIVESVTMSSPQYLAVSTDTCVRPQGVVKQDGKLFGWNIPVR